MSTLAQYPPHTILYESEQSMVYRTQSAVDHRSVIVKMLRHEDPPPDQIAWFRREYECTKSLHHLPGVVEAQALVTDQYRWAMVLEDFGGDSLDVLQRRRTVPRSLAAPDALGLAAHIDSMSIASVLHQYLCRAKAGPTSTALFLSMVRHKARDLCRREGQSLWLPAGRHKACPYSRETAAIAMEVKKVQARSQVF